MYDQARAAQNVESGKYLAERGYVKKTTTGYRVRQPLREGGEVNLNVTKGEKGIQCDCGEFTSAVEKGIEKWRCLHIWAVAVWNELETKPEDAKPWKGPEPAPEEPPREEPEDEPAAPPEPAPEQDQHKVGKANPAPRDKQTGYYRREDRDEMASELSKLDPQWSQGFIQTIATDDGHLVFYTFYVTLRVFGVERTGMGSGAPTPEGMRHGYYEAFCDAADQFIEDPLFEATRPKALSFADEGGGRVLQDITDPIARTAQTRITAKQGTRIRKAWRAYADAVNDQRSVEQFIEARYEDGVTLEALSKYEGTVLIDELDGKLREAIRNGTGEGKNGDRGGDSRST
jgi:hypothetical protein